MVQFRSGRTISDQSQVVANTIGTEQLIDNNIAAVDIAPNAVGDSEVAAHTTTKITVPTTQLSGTVATAQIADNAVTLDKIEDGTQGDVLIFGASGAPTRLGTGTSGQVLQAGGAGVNPSWVALGVTALNATITAGETMAAGIPVYVEDSATATFSKLVIDAAGANFSRVGDASGNTRQAQSFQVTTATTISQIKAYLTKDGSPTDNLEFRIQADTAGAPSGTSLATGSVAGATVGAAADHSINLNTTVNLAASTTYWIVFERSGSLDAVNYFDVGHNTGNPYASGLQSTYNGTTWSNTAANDLRVEVLLVSQEGRVYPTSAATAGQFVPFAGFTASAVNGAASASVTVAGVATGLSGLTIGGLYYLADARGTVSTSAGTTARKCGIALSATTMRVTDTW